jgi:iron complex outermembrane receptor protein
VRAAVAATLGAAFLLSNPSSANAAEDETELDEVHVTGSRIVRRDFEANSPILTVDENLLKNSSTAAIETQLTKLPQFRPVQTPTIGGDIQSTALNTPGAATVSLRGLGANRNLVLLDGRRATPGNASQVVDINTIPSLAIERVEVITGGASATYGADAVAGVANFIMRKDFEGVQFDTSLAQSSRGDGFEYQVGGVLGANLAHGRGNVMLAFATNERKSSKRVDRPWFRDAMRDPSIAGDEFFPDFSGFDSLFGNAPTQQSYDDIFGAGAVPSTTRLYFNPDGTAFTGFFQSFSPGGVPRFQGDLTGLKWKQTNDGLLGQNFQDTLLVLPLKRDNVFVRGNYDINDSVGFFAQGLFSKVGTQTVQQPSPSVNGWAALIPNDGREIPDELADILGSRDDPTAPWQLTYYLNQANREARVDVFTYNMLAGLNGRIPGSDWTWEIYGSTGESETSSLTTGVASLARFRAVISAPDWGAGFVGDSNPLFGGFGANFATCTSGIDPFNKEVPISADCLAAISSDLKTRAALQQDIWELNTQGSILPLPAGELRAAFGASYRKSRYEFLNDTLTTQGAGFLDQAIGIYPSGNAGGEITAKEIYGELLVPLVRDLPFAQKVELELGVRSSDYNTTGSSTTWKALADWRVVDWLRFRGGYNRAERSPNIGELYLAPSQSFQIGAGGDLCSLTNDGANRQYSANAAFNPNAAAALELCEALMERATPGTAAEFYADGNPANSTVGSTFAFPSVRGNPDLIPEKADTWTIGTVFNSPFESEWLSSLRVSIDYYDIQVKDAIGPQSVDVAQRQCFDPAFNPEFDVDSPFCAAVNRVANDGALGDIQLTYYNNGRFNTRGIDTQIDWGFNAGPGRFTLNSVFTYLIDMKTSELISDPMVEYTGAFGPNQNELNSGSFRWKFLNTFGYKSGKWGGALQWQHVPSIKSITYATNSSTNIRGAPSYNLLNLYGSYALSDDILIRFGIDNALDKAPPLLERNLDPDLPAFLLPGGTFGGANATDPPQYDFIGRRFFIGATVRL